MGRGNKGGGKGFRAGRGKRDRSRSAGST